MDQEQRKKYQKALISAEKILSGRRNRQLLEDFIRESGLLGEFRRYLVQRKLGPIQIPDPIPYRERFLAIFEGDGPDSSEEGRLFWCEWLSEKTVEDAIDTGEWISQGKVEKLVLTKIQAERLKKFLEKDWGRIGKEPEYWAEGSIEEWSREG